MEETLQSHLDLKQNRQNSYKFYSFLRTVQNQKRLSTSGQERTSKNPRGWKIIRKKPYIQL